MIWRFFDMVEGQLREFVGPNWNSTNIRALGLLYVIGTFLPVICLWGVVRLLGLDESGSWMEQRGVFIWLVILFGFPVVWFVKLCADQVAPSRRASHPELSDHNELGNG